MKEISLIFKGGMWDNGVWKRVLGVVNSILWVKLRDKGYIEIFREFKWM